MPRCSTKFCCMGLAALPGKLKHPVENKVNTSDGLGKNHSFTAS